MDVWNLIASILSGLIVCVPLVIKLVNVTKESIQKGNWNKLVNMVTGYMVEAEAKIEDGATRKEWVMGMISSSANSLDYKLTESEWQKISDMIDSLCVMAKTVNANAKEGEAT